MWEAVEPGLPHRYWSDIELISYYLDLNNNWWEDKTNALFGMREQAATLIHCWLENKDEPNGGKNTPYSLIYVINNFERDYLPWFRRM